MDHPSDTEQLLADIDRRIGMAEIDKTEALDRAYARERDPAAYRLVAAKIEAEFTLRTFDMRMHAHSLRRSLDRVRRAEPPSYMINPLKGGRF